MITHTEDLRILTDYRAVLDDALAASDIPRAAEAVATMKQALHMITLDVDPHRHACAAITHSNGTYTPPATTNGRAG